MRQEKYEYSGRAEGEGWMLVRGSSVLTDHQAFRLKDQQEFDRESRWDGLGGSETEGRRTG